MPLEIDDTQIVKVCSVVRHVEELLKEGVATTSAGNFDVIAIRGLLEDPNVELLMAYLDKLALLPVMR